MSHTYAVLEVPPETYRTIRKLLSEAGYAHAFHDSAEGEVIDMHGIALRSEPEDQPAMIRDSERLS